MEIIKIENLTFSYPGCSEKALDEISFSVKKGEFVTLCGKSGCGKSTLLRLLKPLISPVGEKKGKIFFENRELSEISAREQCEKIAFVMQNADNQAVTDTVWHELAFGLESLGFSNSEIRARVAEITSYFGMETWFYTPLSELSGGQKQLLCLASVMVTKPSLLVLDEPTSQLDPIAANEFLSILKKINTEFGTTVILSEHRTDEVFGISDRVIVMDSGKIVNNDSPRNVGKKLFEEKNPMFAAMPVPMRVFYALNSGEIPPLNVREGRDFLENYTDLKKPVFKNTQGADKSFSDENVLTVKNVWFRYEKNSKDILKNFNLTVKKGEMYAVVGGNGSGKTTALSVINGLYKQYRGNVVCKGKISMLPQNPEDIFSKKTVEAELNDMSNEPKLSEIVSFCDLGHLLHRHPYDLSGGEKQRLALAKILLTCPDILLLDEPTKGMDACFKGRFAKLLSGLKARGVTIIIVSHDLEFCGKYADRMGMFFDGGITTEGPPKVFLEGNSFYTTVAARIAEGIIPGAVTEEDIISACGGINFEPQSTEIKTNPLPEAKPVQKKKNTGGFKWLTGAVFLLCYCLWQFVFAGKISNYFVAQGIGYLLLAGVLAAFIPNRKITEPGNRAKLNLYSILSGLFVLIAVPLTIWAGNKFFDNRKYYFISMLIIAETMVPIIFSFEKKKPDAKKLVIISVLAAIGIVGRTALTAFPQFKPVLAVAIIAGICLGAESGFMTGVMIAFVSNFFMGQGPHTPWQMFGMGIIGYLTGVLYNLNLLRKTRLSLCVFGALGSVFIYGLIMNVSTVIMYQDKPTFAMLAASCAAGLPFDTILAFATAFFLWFAAIPMIEQIDRIKTKYGID